MFRKYDERRRKMERIPKGIYTPEFRAEAMKLVKESGQRVGMVAKRLSVPNVSL
jgi:transposase